MTKLKLVAAFLVATTLACFGQAMVSTPSWIVQVFDNQNNAVTTATGATVYENDRTWVPSSYKIVCDGDSISQDGPFGNSQWQPGYCGYVVRALYARRINASYASLGMSGYSWNYSYPQGQFPPGYTITTLASTAIDSQQQKGLTNILIGFAGTNGIWLANHSAATEYTDFQAWFSARTAAGWTAGRIIVVTTLPRQDSASFDTTRATYNASLKSFCMSNGCLIADAGGDATVGCNGCEDNTNCYLSDKIHPSGTGSCGGYAGGGMQYIGASLIAPQVP